MEELSLNEILHKTITNLTPDLSPKDRNKLIESFDNLLFEGIPIRESLDLNDDTMEYLYSYGHGLFTAGKFDAAARMFQVLYMLNPLDSRYALGVAASYQMGKEYEKAIGWYLALSAIDEHSPLPFYYMSDCFLKQNETKASLEYLKKTVERCGEIPEFSSLKERTLRMITSLEEPMQKEEAKTYDH